MSHYLYLLRHAKAVPWGPGIDDFSRRLASRGRLHANALAAWAGENLSPPQVVLCSPSARTVETLAPWLDTWPQLETLTEHPRSLYHASPGTLLDLLDRAFAGAGTVLMVGHNPGFEDLAFSLVPEHHTRNIWKMATGTLGVFEFAEWPDPDEEDVSLRHWVTRRDLSVD